MTLLEPDSAPAEAFRQLRTALQFHSLDRPLRTILATCTGREEGKTATLANLAVSMAQAGRRVVLVDCDLRRPGLHHLFGLGNSVGLSTAILTDDQLLPLQETGIPELQLLSSGPPPPNPSEVLGSARMAAIIELLRSQADYVLFDAPPIIAVTDAAVLAPKMDGVLLVLRSGTTKRERAQQARRLLEGVHANILGVILTNAKDGMDSPHTDRERRVP